MKLARPNIRHPRIVLAGSPGDDDGGLIPALRRRGLHARWMSWDEPDVLRADLVILRAIEVHRDRLDAFLVWTRRVRNLLNPPDVIAWNADHGYLRDLEGAGVPTGQEDPPVSAGRTALVFIGGEQSHAFCGESAVEPDFELWDLGHAAMRAAAEHVGIRTAELLYGRADVTGGPGGVRLVGLDLIAPALGWQQLNPDACDLAQRRFALGVASALERLGLGSLSHRRP